MLQALETVDESLVTPQVRAGMEQQVARIAAGEQSKARVVQLTLALFLEKFLTLRGSLPVVYHLFCPTEPSCAHDGASRSAGKGGPVHHYQNHSAAHQRRLELQEDLESAVADIHEKQRREALRAEAAANFAPKSAEEDLLVSLFGGCGGGGTGGGVSALGGALTLTKGLAGGDMANLAALVESGQTCEIKEAWTSAAPAPAAGGSVGRSRGGTGSRSARGGGRGRGRGR